jgi:transcriptional regulator GlxA family with amidase domain
MGSIWYREAYMSYFKEVSIKPAFSAYRKLASARYESLGRKNDQARRKPLSVGIVLSANFTLSAFSLFVDTLRLAADESDRSRPIGCQWVVMSSRSEPIRSSSGVQVNRTSPFRDPKEFDYIVVIGGTLHHDRPINEEAIAYLHAAACSQVSLIGICTGSFILSRAGLMQNRRSCVSWLHYQDFCEEFPDQAVSADRLFEVDGDRITCAGGAAAADLAAWLIERHLGRSVAHKPHHVLLLDRARTTNAVQPHPPLAEATADVRIRRALLLMEQHLADPLPISSIAEMLSLSTRQLERLFHAELASGPSIFYRMLRLRYAYWLLDNTDRSITEIALDAGFSDCAHFSRQFKAAHGFPPSNARSANRAAAPVLDGMAPISIPPARMPHARRAECAGSRVFE